MTIPVIINGATGKMGAVACQAIQAQSEFKLVASLGRDDDLAESIIKHHNPIVIDLTSAECVYANTLTIIQNNAHPVIGSSGLVDDQIAHLRQLCQTQQLGGIIVPNFSIAAVLMMRFAAMASHWMPEVEIIETHHQQKLDSPSGTALKTAQLIADARTKAKQLLPNKAAIPGARGAVYRDINIHSLRLPGVLAKQEVIFGSPGETLSIVHDSMDRNAFMPGLILACQRVQALNTLYYGLEQLLDF